MLLVSDHITDVSASFSGFFYLDTLLVYQLVYC